MIENLMTYRGKKAKQAWTEDTDFSNLKNITQVYGFLFNDENEILIVSPNDGKNWTLPGGSPEPEDKSYIDTLIREVDEEADVEIEKITPLGYIVTLFIGEPGSEHQQLRYIAKIAKIKKQTKDPAYDKVHLRKFIKPEEFLNYCPWGKIGKAMLDKAVKTFNP